MSSQFIICKWLVRRISTTFQYHFKICLLWFLHEKECSFYTHLFCCTEMGWLSISSTAIWVTGSDTSSVAFRARTKLTSKFWVTSNFLGTKMCIMRLIGVFQTILNWFHFQTTEIFADNQNCQSVSRPLGNKIPMVF